MKRVNIRCPYCGSRALLRPASVVYGPRAADPAAPYYVCARYPACDSYVAAHRDTHLPMGTLADRPLRRKRIDAHRAFDRLWESGLMTKKQAYLWLQAKLDLPEREAHIGKFSWFRCEEVIRLCDDCFPAVGKASKPVQLEDWVCFHCTRCGNCCRDLEGQLMLEPADAYELARYLRAQGRADSIHDVYERYAHADILEGNLPIYLMNTVGYNHACVFLNNGQCSAYEARPQMCRIYPFFVCPEEPGHPFEAFQCMDSHAAHFTGGKVLVKDWLRENYSEERRGIMTAEAAVLPVLGQMLKRFNFNRDKAALFQALHYRYYNYDLDKPFLPQYISNMAALQQFLRERLGEV